MSLLLIMLISGQTSFICTHRVCVPRRRPAVRGGVCGRLPDAGRLHGRAGGAVHGRDARQDALFKSGGAGRRRLQVQGPAAGGGSPARKAP